MFTINQGEISIGRKQVPIEQGNIINGFHQQPLTLTSTTRYLIYKKKEEIALAPLHALIRYISRLLIILQMILLSILLAY